MNHRREGDGRQKRKIGDLDYAPRPAENDLLRLPRRPLEHPQNRVTYASVVSGQRTKDPGKAMTPIVVTVPDTDRNLEWLVYLCLRLMTVAAVSEITLLANSHSVRLLLRIYSVSIVPSDMQRRKLLKQGWPIMSFSYFRFNLGCMDVSECAATFSEREIQRFLDKRAYERFDQLRTDDANSTGTYIDKVCADKGWSGWPGILSILSVCSDYGRSNR